MSVPLAGGRTLVRGAFPACVLFLLLFIALLRTAYVLKLTHHGDRQAHVGTALQRFPSDQRRKAARVLATCWSGLRLL
jgi:hypothetical protein